MWGSFMNSQLIEAHAKEKYAELLHEAQINQMLNQLSGDRPGSLHHLVHNAGDFFILLGGWLKSH